jgi:hypothetical protein
MMYLMLLPSFSSLNFVMHSGETWTLKGEVSDVVYIVNNIVLSCRVCCGRAGDIDCAAGRQWRIDGGAEKWRLLTLIETIQNIMSACVLYRDIIYISIYMRCAKDFHTILLCCDQTMRLGKL